MTWKAVHSMWLNENELQNNVFVTLFLICVHVHKHTQTYLHEHRKSLAWRIPGTGESGRLPLMGLQSRTRLK